MASTGLKLGLALKARARARAERFGEIRDLARRFTALGRYDTPEAYAYLVKWVRARFAEAGKRKAVLGVSGGVDSSAVACVLQDALGPEHVLACALPCGSNVADERDAAALCKALDLTLTRIDLGPAFEALRQTLAGGGAAAEANLKVRLRTTALFHLAAVHDALVVGTGDLDEGFIGYYTKGSSSDISVLAALHKSEVRRLLKWALGRLDPKLARRLAMKPAHAGLGPHTAEQELGVTYDVIERALEVVARSCDALEAGLVPRSVDEFAEAFDASGLTVQEFQRVEALVHRARHKSRVPVLWRQDPAVRTEFEPW